MKGQKADPSAQKRSAGLSPSSTRLLAVAGVSLSRGQPDVAEHALIGVLALAPASAEAIEPQPSTDVTPPPSIFCAERSSAVRAMHLA